MRIDGSTYAFFGIALLSLSVSDACSATGGTGVFTSSTGTSEGTGGANTTPSSGTDGQGGLNLGVGGSTGSGVINPPCDFKDPKGDHDGDGFTVADGDCNDCSAAMNPGAQDFA